MRSRKVMPAQEERQPMEKILIDLPSITPSRINAARVWTLWRHYPPPHLSQSWEKGNVGVVDAIRISRAPFCQQNGEKSFLRKKKKRKRDKAAKCNITPDMWVESTSTASPPDLTLVAITWHIKAISALTFLPPLFFQPSRSHRRRFSPVGMSPF